MPVIPVQHAQEHKRASFGVTKEEFIVSLESCEVKLVKTDANRQWDNKGNWVGDTHR